MDRARRPSTASSHTQVQRSSLASAKSEANSSTTNPHTMPKCTVEAEAGPFAREGAQAQAAILEEKARLPKDPDVVEFDGPMDPLNPQNWSKWEKAGQTLLLGLTAFVVTFASSIFSTGVTAVAEEFNVSPEVSTLGTSLFVLGFAFGPLLWGPMSEFNGRKVPLLGSYLCFCIFQIPVAVAQNLETIMICRFFGGLFASGPLAIVGGALADLYPSAPRGIAMATFAGSVFGGPPLGAIVGGFVTKSRLGWRWTAWLTAIMGISMFIICVFFLSESYAPRLLQLKAKKIRYSEKRWAVRSKLDETQFSLQDVATKFFFRPIRMLVSEPMLLLLTIYSSFIYGILYLQFGALPIEYQQHRGWSAGVSDLPFLGVFAGIFIGCLIIIYFNPRYARKLEANGGRPIPEERLIPMMIGGVLFPVGAFWFAWTDVSHVESWVPSVFALAFVGAGVLLIFLQTMNFIVDTYLFMANSAMAANAFCRGLAGAGFPLFTAAMFGNLGVDWAASTIGFLAVAMPIPFLFYVYGPTLRKMSKFAP